MLLLSETPQIYFYQFAILQFHLSNPLVHQKHHFLRPSSSWMWNLFLQHYSDVEQNCCIGIFVTLWLSRLMIQRKLLPERETWEIRNDLNKCYQNKICYTGNNEMENIFHVFNKFQIKYFQYLYHNLPASMYSTLTMTIGGTCFWANPTKNTIKADERSIMQTREQDTHKFLIPAKKKKKQDMKHKWICKLIIQTMYLDTRIQTVLHHLKIEPWED